MNSTIAWLDTSSDEQRRVRELIALFSEKGTLDELGIGQIRDVFSNALFPGTSTIQTRARYFLLVPWAFVSSQRPGREGAVLRQHADHSQRVLVETLRALPDRRGVIGAQVGAQVRNLPSTIYWNGLLTFGVLQRDVSPDDLMPVREHPDDADELAVRALGDWHPTLPAVPPGFPSTLEGGLTMTAPEASWLRERILERVPDTLLAHLVAGDQGLDPANPYPWFDPACVGASAAVREVLQHAHIFSLFMEGASRLYGVLVAEAYEEAGFTSFPGVTAVHLEGYQTWWEAVEQQRHLLEMWDQDAFWGFVRRRNERVSLLTQSFVERWSQFVLNGTAKDALQPESQARVVVAERERTVKRRQARLANFKLLELWGGGTGGGLTYRWPTVRTIVTDIHEGLRHA